MFIKNINIYNNQQKLTQHICYIKSSPADAIINNQFYIYCEEIYINNKNKYVKVV